MMHFFMPMEPPTTTAQMHKVSTRGRKPRFYDPPEVTEMKAKLRAYLAPHRPETPLLGPVRAHFHWIWFGDVEAWKPTKPDTGNIQKAILDEMTKLGYWLDDAQICDERCKKSWGPIPGIYVEIEVLS